MCAFAQSWLPCDLRGSCACVPLCVLHALRASPQVLGQSPFHLWVTALGQAGASDALGKKEDSIKAWKES